MYDHVNVPTLIISWLVIEPWRKLNETDMKDFHQKKSKGNTMKHYLKSEDFCCLSHRDDGTGQGWFSMVVSTVFALHQFHTLHSQKQWMKAELNTFTRGHWHPFKLILSIAAPEKCWAHTKNKGSLQRFDLGVGPTYPTSWATFTSDFRFRLKQQYRTCWRKFNCNARWGLVAYKVGIECDVWLGILIESRRYAYNIN